MGKRHIHVSTEAHPRQKDDPTVISIGELARELESIRKAEAKAERLRSEWIRFAPIVYEIVQSVVDQTNAALQLDTRSGLSGRYDVGMVYADVPQIQIDTPTTFLGLVARETEHDVCHVRSIGARLVMACRHSGEVCAVYFPGKLDDPFAPRSIVETTTLSVLEPGEISEVEVRTILHSFLNLARTEHWAVR